MQVSDEDQRSRRPSRKCPESLGCLRLEPGENRTKCGRDGRNIPNSQFSASSVFSDTRFSLSLKNGRSMRYALDRRTFGNTFNVPCVGAVSLCNQEGSLRAGWQRRMSYLNASHPWNVRKTLAYKQ